ncbi:MEKHLA domain-containing protein [Parafrankia elaeagni]
MEDTTIWNLVDRDGTLQGQAAMIRAWYDGCDGCDA